LKIKEAGNATQSTNNISNAIENKTITQQPLADQTATGTKEAKDSEVSTNNIKASPAEVKGVKQPSSTHLHSVRMNRPT